MSANKKNIFIFGCKHVLRLLDKSDWFQNFNFIVNPIDGQRFLNPLKRFNDIEISSLKENINSLLKEADVFIFQHYTENQLIDGMPCSQYIYDNLLKSDCLSVCLPKFDFYPYHIELDENNKIILDLVEQNKNANNSVIFDNLMQSERDSSIKIIETSFGSCMKQKLLEERKYSFLYENSVCDYDFIKSNFKNMLLSTRLGPTDFYYEYILKQMSKLDGFEDISNSEMKTCEFDHQMKLFDLTSTPFFIKKFKLHYNNYNKPFIDAGKKTGSQMKEELWKILNKI
jgi:hypothetical protein